MLEWLFWEQFSHEPTLAVRRFQKVYLGKADSEIDPTLLERGNAALMRMENHLERRQWLVDDFSAADLCLLPYTALAPEGGFDLAQFPAVSDWISRVYDRSEEHTSELQSLMRILYAVFSLEKKK